MPLTTKSPKPTANCPESFVMIITLLFRVKNLLGKTRHPEKIPDLFILFLPPPELNIFHSRFTCNVFVCNVFVIGVVFVMNASCQIQVRPPDGYAFMPCCNSSRIAGRQPNKCMGACPRTERSPKSTSSVDWPSASATADEQMTG